MFGFVLIFGESRKASMAARTVGPPVLPGAVSRVPSLVTVAAIVALDSVDLPDNAHESRP
ncbi:hypothetical protein N5079_23030 [Planotetraspora sp. A-T 1434]|uniref:hypothetical protein n=1 Tax=Planotetraspora sp. A-T 1434 TaxID=2979219 RepID=UPI0021BEC939|nr:hypothetical protein [Planotetraspora sp. A-T 1434]MCT9933086.1 hypothetical protein [Planotetraspora sp. A-T 1434]